LCATAQACDKNMKEFPPFRLDTVNQCLWRRRESHDDERISLTPRAFGVLRYLVEHSGRLITHDELLNALWPDTFVQPEVLKSHILDVRSVLGDHPKNPKFIETLPKRGYQFIAAVTDASAEVTTGPEQPSRKLVGRSATFAQLSESLQRALRGQRQIIFVTGEPGIGKTSLVDEFQRQIVPKVPQIRLGRGQCVEGYGGTEPYYPVLEALSQLCRGPEGDSVVQILATRAPTSLAQFPALFRREMLQHEILGATRERMLREIGEALDAIASENPLLLVLEDLHWADHSTVDLISALARRRQSAKLMLIGTCRAVDMVLSGHPLKALKQDLLIHRLCNEVILDPLDEAAVAEYLAAESEGAAVPEGLAGLIYRHSEGNPLFMVAALEHMTRRGFVSREKVQWKLNVPLEEIDLEVPESLRQMIEIQIDRLSTEEQRVLEMASLESVGRSRFAIVPRAAIGDLKLEVFEDVCETLSRRHCILRSADSAKFPDGTISACYEFVHALYREVCYRRIAPGRRAKLHRRLGEWVEAHLEQTPEIAAWLADHFENSGDWLRAIKYLQVVAETASRRYAHWRSAEILRHALDLAQKLPETARSASESQTLEKLANTYLVSGDMRGLDTYEALAERAAQSGQVDVEIGALMGLAWSSQWISGERCLMAVERALQLSSGQRDPLVRARTRMNCSNWRMCVAGWNSKDAEACRSALAAIHDAGDRLALATHMVDYSWIQWVSSAYRDALHTATESLGILAAAREKDPYQVSDQWCRISSGLNFMFLGNWGEASQNLKAGIAMMGKNESYMYAQALRLFLAWLHLHAQDSAGAVAICESAVPLIRLANQPLTPKSPTVSNEFRMCLILIGSAEAALGNYERAFEYLITARDEMDRQMMAWDWYWRMPLESGLTELWLAQGDLAQARPHAERFLKLALATAEHTWQALAWEANARVAMAERDLRRAQDCIANGLSSMEGFEVPLAAWRVHATACELAQNSGNRNLAEHYLALSRNTIIQLANSLPVEEPLRQAFLSALSVRKVLGEPESAAPAGVHK
jgi:DNA-binding winged helix-turn-helix (wHTH) protein/tetratricopeptide (TPR) repeat protein